MSTTVGASDSQISQPTKAALLTPLLLTVAILQRPWLVLCQPSEQSILYDFYNSTSGWTSGCSGGWSTNTTPLCSGDSSNWARVTCTTDHVMRIDLCGCGINGTLPPEWSSMTNMQTLYLCSNNFNGTVPPQWSNLTNMQILMLYGNSLSGTLPPQWSSLTNMRELYLSSNSLSGTLPPQWSNMKNMLWLTLYHNSLSGTLPPQWSSLTHMWGLWLYSNSLSGTLPSQWSSLTNMRDLELNKNSFSGTLPWQWSNMTFMESLSLQYNSFIGTLPPQWSNLTYLRIVDLSSNFLSGTLPPQWSALTLVTRCGVGGNCLNLSNATAWWATKSISPQRSDCTLVKSTSVSMAKATSVLFTTSAALSTSVSLVTSAALSTSVSFVTSAALSTSVSFVTSAALSTSVSFVTSAALSTSVSFVTSALSTSASLSISQRTGSIRPTVSGSSTYVIDQLVVYDTSHLASAARTVAAAAAIAPMLAGAGIASMGCSAVQLSVASSLLANRRREPSNIDGIGASLLENPLQLKLPSLPLSLQLTGGAVIGNAVVCAIVVVCGALVSHLFEEERRHLCDVMNVWRALRTHFMERLPGALLPPIGLLLQPTLASSLSLIISPHRTAGSCVLGALASVAFVGGLAWTTFTVRVGVLSERVLCAPNIVALLPSGVEGCWHTAPRCHWAPFSKSLDDQVFFLRFGPFFTNSMNDRSMYFAFDLWSTVAVALLTAIGLSLDDAAVALPASGVLCGIALVRLLTVVGLRPFSVVPSNVFAALLEALGVACTVLGCVDSGDVGEEAILWLSVVQISIIGLSGLADCAMRVCAICRAYLTAVDDRKRGQRPLQSGTGFVKSDSHEAEVNRVLRELVTHICAQRIVKNHKSSERSIDSLSWCLYQSVE